MLKTVPILGVNVAAGLTRSGLLDLAAGWAAQDQLRTILYANAHSLNLARREAAFRAILNQADLVYPDGAGAAWAGRFLHRCRMEKLTGADWIDDFCSRAAQAGWRLYLLGGRAGVAQSAAQHLQMRHPGLQVAGAGQGYFDTGQDETIIQAIQAVHPQVLLVGMGSPRQEFWLSQRRDRLPAPLCWGVGALFDYLAGVERRAPAWLRAASGEWLWRLALDPRGKWRRYLLGNPGFVLRVLAEKWKAKK